MGNPVGAGCCDRRSCILAFFKGSNLIRLKDEAVVHGRMVPRQSFLDSTRSIYEQSKRFSPGSLISWILRPLGLDGKAASLDSLPVGDYVLLRNVEVSVSPPVLV